MERGRIENVDEDIFIGGLFEDQPLSADVESSENGSGSPKLVNGTDSLSSASGWDVNAKAQRVIDVWPNPEVVNNADPKTSKKSFPNPFVKTPGKIRFIPGLNSRRGGKGKSVRNQSSSKNRPLKVSVSQSDIPKVSKKRKLSPDANTVWEFAKDFGCTSNKSDADVLKFLETLGKN